MRVRVRVSVRMRVRVRVGVRARVRVRILGILDIVVSDLHQCVTLAVGKRSGWRVMMRVRVSASVSGGESVPRPTRLPTRLLD